MSCMENVLQVNNKNKLFLSTEIRGYIYIRWCIIIFC